MKTVGVRQTVKSMNAAAENFNRLAPEATRLLETANQIIPQIQVAARSLCDKGIIIDQFANAATVLGMGANLILAYQGVQALKLIAAHLKCISNATEAQTTLMAQRDFPQYVYDLVCERLGQTRDDKRQKHWFFLYHPDNDWHPKFYHLLNKRRAGEAFCAYSNQIDSIFTLMLAARRYIERERHDARIQGRKLLPVKLHLLIPAYRTVLIAEALRIPEEIGDFIIEGRSSNNIELVWLSLPEDQQHYTAGIGRWVPPTQSAWKAVLSKVGLADKAPTLGSPRLLGSGRHALDNHGAMLNSGQPVPVNQSIALGIRPTEPDHHGHQTGPALLPPSRSQRESTPGRGYGQSQVQPRRGRSTTSRRRSERRGSS